ncbi:GGDEF domain-containing protein [Paenibacillus thailandensis]|uniref:GGDEF domain-containing protein n=1 Tax=Paenibacillus thailandensis TaxID=393250 RepID=UPI0036317658
MTELRLLIEETNAQNELLHERNIELMEIQEELSRANKKLEHMAVTDGLTGCFNRRYLLRQLEREVTVSMEYGTPFSIIMFDIDLFKAINDNHGHLVGDTVLKGTVEAVREVLRAGDILARFGGEEFTVYLPHTTREQAALVAERIKEAVQHNEMNVGDAGLTVSVTISIESYRSTTRRRPESPRMSKVHRQAV